MERDWTEEQIAGMRGRLAEAKRQGLWISAIEVNMFLGLLTWWQRVSTTSWRRPIEGHLPTVGEARRQGVTHVFVMCDRGCVRADRKIAIADLYMPPGRRPLPDSTALLDIPNLCRFRCVKCNGRKVRVTLSWPAGPGMGGAHGQAGTTPRLTSGGVWQDGHEDG